MTNPKFPFPIRDVKIELNRGRCYGECPIYEIYLSGSETCYYFGKEFVKEIGTHELAACSNIIMDILTKAVEIGYWDLENNYEQEHKCELDDNNMVHYNPQGKFTDLPETTIEIKIGKKVKRVRAYDGYPNRLDEFAEFIDKRSGAIKFISESE